MRETNATTKTNTGTGGVEGVAQLSDMFSTFFDPISTFLGAHAPLLTLVVVVCTAVVTNLSNRRLTRQQLALADIANKQQLELADKAHKADHENKVSDFRHHWLQEVRITSSQMIKSIHECQEHTAKKNRRIEWRDKAEYTGNEELGKKYQGQIDNILVQLSESRAEFYMHYSKLVLLFKAGDMAAAELFIELSKFKDGIGDLDTFDTNDETISSIISHVQTVLKKEWEITKNRSWLETSHPTLEE